MHAGLQGAAMQRWPEIGPSSILELTQVQHLLSSKQSMAVCTRRPLLHALIWQLLLCR